MPRSIKPKRQAMAFGYGRVSTARQAISIEIQKEQVEGYYAWRLKPIGVGWADWYCDPAVKGKVPFKQRPAGFALATRAEPGDHIIIAKLDRSFRNRTDCFQCMDSWTDRGITVHCLDIGIDTSTPAGKLMLGLLAVFAEWERDRIRERVNDVYRHRRAHGGPVGQCKIGFLVERDKTGQRVLVPFLEELRVMARIYLLRQNGETFERIAQKFTEAGVKGRRCSFSGNKIDPNKTTWRYASVCKLHHAYVKLLETGKLPESVRPEAFESSPKDATTPSDVTPSPG